MAELDLRIRTASLGGFVSDAESELPIVGAKIDIVAGPEEFELKRRIKRQGVSEWEWKHRKERIDRTQSRKDGSYYFANLPPGQYHLRCVAQKREFHYEVAEAEGVIVSPIPEDIAPMTNFVLTPVKPE
ncbi:MAG: carboxypeptidase regulatory-like domain-containing protein [Chloroflexi bacterium]|nr:MAG: hypothetical protein CUN54_04580 [Phototrophicales bacterium]RMF77756.1 MAG: carboxypeptidase regulatory-like domain-containing protein [Chloroflexota bacterium]